MTERKAALTISATEVSALMDNELTRHECDNAVAGLARQNDMRRLWQRYHLMRTALRHEPHYPVSADLADRIAARIHTDAIPAKNIVSRLRWPSPARRSAAYGTAYKGVAGLALAASVAAVAIVGVRTLAPISTPTPPLAAVAPSAVAPTPVAVATGPRKSRRGIHWDTAQPELENNLNAFLVQHSEFTRTSGMGVMSYVRIAGYDTNYDHGKE